MIYPFAHDHECSTYFIIFSKGKLRFPKVHEGEGHQLQSLSLHASLKINPLKVYTYYIQHLNNCSLIIMYVARPLKYHFAKCFDERQPQKFPPLPHFSIYIMYIPLRCNISHMCIPDS